MIKKIKKLAKSILFPIFIPRKTHSYGIGAWKSGTTSLCGLFKKNYRTQHEPASREILPVIMDYNDGKMSDQQVQKFIHSRDKKLWLELDSSYFNIYVLNFLVKEFTDAKFILTIRDCYSWLNSCYNHLSGRELRSHQRTFVDWVIGQEHFIHNKNEKLFYDNGLPPIDSLLSYWLKHNQQAINTVPKERLLVIRTTDLNRKFHKIAQFLEIPPDTLDVSQSHLNKAPKKTDFITQIDKHFIEERVKKRCNDLMLQFFPDIECFDDAF